ncbi:MAG: nucleotidyltransferase family protein [Defluviitaleaceae bacterium]|nr:nucleotidyltransferase family protein [Defluviitaleaceae bacterium]
MKSIILAAGYATRLYPVTLKRPKSLLPINGKPIIDYIVDELVAMPDISKIYVIVNELFAKDFHDWRQRSDYASQIEIVNDNTISDDTKLGAIGDIHFCIKEKNIAEDTLVIAGDTFFSFKLKDFYDFYNNNKKDCVCVEEINDTQKLKNFAVAMLDGNKIVNLVEKPQLPKSNVAVFAIYIYKKETMALVEKYLQEGNKPDAPGHFVEWLYKKQDVLAYKVQGNCFDIGTLAGYNQVQELVRQGKIKGV